MHVYITCTHHVHVHVIRITSTYTCSTYTCIVFCTNNEYMYCTPMISIYHVARALPVRPCHFMQDCSMSEGKTFYLVRVRYRQELLL